MINVFFNPSAMKFRLVRLTCLSLLCLLSVHAVAQMQDALAGLPEVRHLSAALSEPETRTDTLLTTIAVARLLEYGAAGDSAEYEDITARFEAERRWLDELAARYEVLPFRAPVFDAAAWYLGQELAQHGLAPGLEDSPLGPGLRQSIDILFDRSNTALAASLLPELLPRYELKATIIWTRLLDGAAMNSSLLAALTALDAEWFDPWLAAEPPAPLPDNDPDDDIFDAIESFRILVESLVREGPPDALRMRRLRFELQRHLPSMEPAEAQQTEYLLLLAAAIDGLAESRYLSYSEYVLWIVSDLLIRETLSLSSDPLRQGTAELMAQMIPVVSQKWADAFDAVDPRIGTSLQTASEVSQYLASGERNAIHFARLQGIVADAVAQMGLMIPDMAFYFDQPIRRSISEEINRCIGLISARDVNGENQVNQNQFNGCMQQLEQLARQQAAVQEIAGDPDGPFGTDQVLRELTLTPSQRINYLLGFLHENNGEACVLPDEPVANPLEWAAIVNSLVWMARQSPELFNTPENERLVLELIQQGRRNIASVSSLLDCVGGLGGGINDPIIQGMENYRSALNNLARSIAETEQEFRVERLRPGADVNLQRDSTQTTAFRPDSLVIGPCDTENVCEMTGNLEATRALAGLFPDQYLLAHQTLLGEIEICYDNVRWVERRAEAVREDDPFVANYFGRLSYDLVGKYREKDEEYTVFTSNMVSPTEHHYLFGPATDEVEQDDCPMEWVGTRVVTSLNTENRIRVVPDRLTYLSGVRTRPSEVLAANWSRGDEWRDRFVTGLGVDLLPVASDKALTDRLDEHLAALHQVAQQEIYTDLLTPRKRNRFQADTLYELLEGLEAQKVLLSAQLNVFYSQELQSSALLRSAIAGNEALLDTQQIRRFRSNRTPMTDIQPVGLQRLSQMQSAWMQMPEPVRRSGSVSVSMVQALWRLNQLHEQVFTDRVDLPQPRLELLPPAN